MSTLRPGELIDGRFEVRGLLGRGGMGAVYRALDRTRAVEVALKLVRVELAEAVDIMRFVREAELAARVDRLEGVIRVHAAGRHAGAPFYVMELAAGRDLQALLREQGPLEPQRLARIVEALARTLGACHAAGVVHRDVKPGNVLLGPDDRPRLVDFGLARDVRRETRMTATGEVLGTPAYMAPEQVRGDPVDGRADVYALGGLLFAGLTGRAPYEGPVLKLLDAKLTEDPPRPSSVRPGVPSVLEAICLRAMAREPDHRYSTAEALADDLARWSRGEATTAEGARRGRPRALLAGAIGGLVALAALAAWASTWPGARLETTLEATLEWDGVRCDEAPDRCRGGEHVLVASAFGLGERPAPGLEEVRARHAALDEALAAFAGEGPREVRDELGRLAAWARHLEGAPPSAANAREGPTGLLVDALRACSAGELADAARLLSAAAAAGPPPEAARVAAHLRLGVLRAAALDGVAVETLSRLPAPLAAAPSSGGAERTRAALRDPAVVAAWAARLRAPDAPLELALRALSCVLADLPASDDARRDLAGFLERVWLELGELALDRACHLDGGFSALARGAFAPQRRLTAALERELPRGELDVFTSERPVRVAPARLSPRVLLAALRHGLVVDIAALEPARREALREAAPAGSEVAAYVRLLEAREAAERDPRALVTLQARALALLAVPVKELPAESRLEAVEVAMRATLATAGRARSRSRAELLPRLALVRALAAWYRGALDRGDRPPNTGAPGRMARLDLVARELLHGLDRAPGHAAELADDARRRAARVRGAAAWLAPTLVELARALLDPTSLDERGAPPPPERLRLIEALLRDALALEPHQLVAMDARAALAKLYRRAERPEDAEDALTPFLAHDIWTRPFAVEAIRSAHERGDQATFRERARRGWERHQRDPLLQELAREAGVLPR